MAVTNNKFKLSLINQLIKPFKKLKCIINKLSRG